MDVSTNNQEIHIWRFFLWVGFAHLKKKTNPMETPIEIPSGNQTCPWKMPELLICQRKWQPCKVQDGYVLTRPLKKSNAMNIPSGEHIYINISNISGHSSVVYDRFPIPTLAASQSKPSDGSDACARWWDGPPPASAQKTPVNRPGKRKQTCIHTMCMHIYVVHMYVRV